METLLNMAKQGFSYNVIDIALNHIEFNSKFINQEFPQNIMENTITHFINQNLELDFLNVKINL